MTNRSITTQSTPSTTIRCHPLPSLPFHSIPEILKHSSILHTRSSGRRQREAEQSSAASKPGPDCTDRPGPFSSSGGINQSGFHGKNSLVAHNISQQPAEGERDGWMDPPGAGVTCRYAANFTLLRSFPTKRVYGN